MQDQFLRVAACNLLNFPIDVPVKPPSVLNSRPITQFTCLDFEGKRQLTLMFFSALHVHMDMMYISQCIALSVEQAVTFIHSKHSISWRANAGDKLMVLYMWDAH